MDSNTTEWSRTSYSLRFALKLFEFSMSKSGCCWVPISPARAGCGASLASWGLGGPPKSRTRTVSIWKEPCCSVSRTGSNTTSPAVEVFQVKLMWPTASCAGVFLFKLFLGAACWNLTRSCCDTCHYENSTQVHQVQNALRKRPAVAGQVEFQLGDANDRLATRRTSGALIQWFSSLPCYLTANHRVRAAKSSA
jgi:hypothetical protein